MCAIRPDHEVKGDLDLLGARRCWCTVSDLEPRLALSEVRPCELVVEERLDVLEVVQGVEQLFIQPASVDCEDGLLGV
jgi:hypothetical protein